MAELSYQQSLTQTGLTRDQAAVYEALVKHGSLPASSAARIAGIGRPLTYKVLDELIALSLVEKKDEPKQIARFIPAHPLKLKEVVEKRLDEAQGAQTALDGILGKLTSDFNLQSGKPGIRFYEGESGIEQVLNDSLTSKTEIYTYADVEAIDKYIPEINRHYVAQREKLQIKKKGLAFDTPNTRYFLEGYHPGITEMKLMNWSAVPFRTIMQIYDNKVSYFTLGESNLISIIISDPHIFQMHRGIFEFLWESPLAYAPDAAPAIEATQPAPLTP